MRYLESYGMDAGDREVGDDGGIMGDPTFDERAKSVIAAKNRRIRELEKMVRSRSGKEESKQPWARHRSQKNVWVFFYKMRDAE